MRARPQPASLYDSDLVAWTEQQAAALRAKRLDQLDIEHLAEEIADLGGRDRRELDSRIHVLLVHLLQLQFEPERQSSPWLATVRAQRREIRGLLQQSPSSRRLVPTYIADGYEDARQMAATQTGLDIDKFPRICPFSIEQILEGNV